MINESKLTTKKRENLPDKIFGLPDERKYPLNDENHVRLAIKFFLYCPANKKFILASNINKRAKALDMKLHITDDSPFAKYADKNIVTESGIKDFYRDCECIVKRPRVIDWDYMDKALPKEISSVLISIKQRAVSNDKELLQLEKDVKNQLDNLYIITKNIIYNCDHGIACNPFTYLNEIMEQKYEDVLEFSKYNSGLSNGYLTSIFYLIKDLFFAINFVCEMESWTIEKYIETIKEIIVKCECNLFMVNRYTYDALINYQGTIKSALTNKFDTILKQAKEKIKAIEAFKEYIQGSNFSNIYFAPTRYYNFMDVPKDVIKNSTMDLSHTENYLVNTKNEIQSEINIIRMSHNISIIKDEFNEDKNFFLQIPDCTDKAIIFNTIDYMAGSVQPKNIQQYGDYSLTLKDSDLLIFSKYPIIKYIYPSKDKYGDTFYFGVNEKELYILGSTKEPGKVIMIRLYGPPEGEIREARNALIYTNKETLSPIKIQTVTLNKPDPVKKEDLAHLTEGISIDKDGKLSFIFSPKKSFMDEYSENHKLLDMNYKNGNYEGMKRNLAFSFALINTIERDIMYNKNSKATDEIKKDAMKARSFAINDFKTYMKYLNAKEKNFDFTKYYEELGIDKYLISVTPDAIMGIKKLFRAVMLG